MVDTYISRYKINTNLFKNLIKFVSTKTKKQIITIIIIKYYDDCKIYKLTTSYIDNIIGIY